MFNIYEINKQIERNGGSLKFLLSFCLSGNYLPLPLDSIPYLMEIPSFFFETFLYKIHPTNLDSVRLKAKYLVRLQLSESQHNVRRPVSHKLVLCQTVTLVLCHSLGFTSSPTGIMLRSAHQHHSNINLTQSNNFN